MTIDEAVAALVLAINFPKAKDDDKVAEALYTIRYQFVMLKSENEKLTKILNERILGLSSYAAEHWNDPNDKNGVSDHDDVKAAKEADNATE